mgnify:CR=1 FL=1
MNQSATRGEMAIYQAPDGGIQMDVRLEKESLWLNLNQLATLLDRDKSVISRHLRNIFKEGELKHESVVAKNATTASDGKTYQVDYYNLDAIISVGYRVNSIRGTQFRIWATKVLRDHIVQGYTVNQSRLGELHQAVKIIADTAERRDLSGDEAKALLAVVGDYSSALGLLDDYDHQRVAKPVTRGKVTCPLGYAEALHIVEQLRGEFGESAVFGVEKDKGLDAALGAIMQTAGGEEGYPSLEEKAANLLYLLVKNHAFVDGNKRIAVAIFLWFLARNGGLERVPLAQSTLVAMTLMIAESRPQEKDLLVRIVTHFLCGGETP